MIIYLKKRFTVLVSKEWCPVYPGFIKVPFNEHMWRFVIGTRIRYYKREWGWGLSVVKGDDFIRRKQHAWHGEMIKVGKTIENGDKFGFRVDFDKRISDILFNGKVIGNPFTEIPEEIIPIISNSDKGDMTVSIHFLNGIARV